MLVRAVEEQRALHLRYWTAARDESTERIVDPLRNFTMDGHSLPRGVVPPRRGVRIFRVDRIEDVQLLDEPARPPDGLELRDLAEGVYQPASEHLLAVLRLSPAYAWVADYYAIEDVTETPDGLQVSLRVSDPAWVRSLVLGSGGQAGVLSPGWLADQIRADAARALAAYPGPS